jgi:hypothetical protein
MTSMRRLLFLGLLSFGPSLFALPAAAQAQVSDADRAAARDLFFEGVKLQNDGKFTEALDRFNRGQRIFSAPTQLLHIAECQVALGQLVEGAETYRTLIRTPLPPGSPPAFIQARDQATAELSQVEPRIPTAKIDITPANANSMQVQIDGVPMNNALIGISRPIDPGAHKVTVFAPGYGKQEAQFAIKEREQKTVPIQLQPTGGVVYGPPVVPPPGPGQPTTPTPQPPPYQTTVPTTPPPAATNATQPPAPAPPGEQTQEWTTQKRTSTASLLLGARLGLMFPAGAESGNGSGGTISIGDIANTGGAVGIEGGIRFGNRFFIGLGFEHGAYGKGTQTLTTGLGDVTSTISSNLVDARLAYISNPNGVGFYGEVGLGYRWFLRSETRATVTVDEVDRGAELSLGAGAFIRAGQYLRFIPKISFGIGSFTKRDLTCSGGGCGGLGTTLSGDITDSATHTFVFVGLGGYYNYDLNR